jgi:hypothetical protein
MKQHFRDYGNILIIHEQKGSQTFCIYFTRDDHLWLETESVRKSSFLLPS